MKTSLSLVLPFYNEEAGLENTLRQTWEYLYGLEIPFEMILANDGSTDRSGEIAKAFSEKHVGNILLVSYPQNQGRGFALKEAFSKASMEYVGYIDADLEIPIVYVNNLLLEITRQNADVGLGNKLSTDLNENRSIHRMLATRVLNALIRIFLRSKLSDHQCGLKLFKRSALKTLLPLTLEKRWAFDTEILLLAQQHRLKIVQIPITLERKRKSTVSFVSTSISFMKKIIEFRRRGLSL